PTWTVNMEIEMIAFGFGISRPSEMYVRPRTGSLSPGQVGNNFSAKLLEHVGRDFDLETAAAATKDDPLRRHDPIIDIKRHSSRQRKRRHAADLHTCKRDHFLRRRKRCLRNTHEIRHAPVYIKLRVRQNNTGHELLRLFL